MIEPKLTPEQIKAITNVESTAFDEALKKQSETEYPAFEETETWRKIDKIIATKIDESDAVFIDTECIPYTDVSLMCFIDSLDTYLSLASGYTSQAFCIAEKVC